MIITGVVRLGRDAELKVSPSGTSVANFSGAFAYGKKDDNGERPTQWVSFELWGDRAEKLAPMLLKGQQIWVSANRVRVREFTKRDGTAGATLEASVQEVELVGGKPAGGDAPQAERRPAAAPPERKTSGHSRFDALEDDIPF